MRRVFHTKMKLKLLINCFAMLRFHRHLFFVHPQSWALFGLWENSIHTHKKRARTFACSFIHTQLDYLFNFPSDSSLSFSFSPFPFFRQSWNFSLTHFTGLTSTRWKSRHSFLSQIFLLNFFFLPPHHISTPPQRAHQLVSTFIIIMLVVRKYF